MLFPPSPSTGVKGNEIKKKHLHLQWRHLIPIPHGFVAVHLIRPKTAFYSIAMIPQHKNLPIEGLP
jgi:hypothetical protein